MNGDGYSTSSWGIGHLSDLPITVSVGFVLLVVLAVLIFLRVAFGSVDVRAGVR